MQNIFRNRDEFALVGLDWIERLKAASLQSPLRRARLCLHRSDDDVLHEMIIALTRDCIFPPHRHPTKTESFHMIEGRMAVVIFDDDGAPLRSLRLAPPGGRGLVCYRLCTPKFHAALPLDDVVVFHEVTNGPFVKRDAVFADWAPQGQDELRAFLHRAAATAPAGSEEPAGAGEYHRLMVHEG